MTPEAALEEVLDLQTLRLVAADLVDLVPPFRPSSAWRDHLEWQRGRESAEQLLEAGARHQVIAGEAFELLSGVALGPSGLQSGRSILRRVAVLLGELGVDRATFPRGGAPARDGTFRNPFRKVGRPRCPLTTTSSR